MKEQTNLFRYHERDISLHTTFYNSINELFQFTIPFLRRSDEIFRIVAIFFPLNGKDIKFVFPTDLNK